MATDTTFEGAFPRLSELPGVMSGTQLFTGLSARALDAARELLQAEKTFVMVAGTLPGAVRVREMLAPTPLVDESGLPISHRPDGKVELFRAHASASRRRALLDGLRRGDVRGLVLTPADLEVPGILDSLLSISGCFWLVQEAQAYLGGASRFRPGLASLARVAGAADVPALWLFAPVADDSALDALSSRFSVDASRRHGSARAFPREVQLDVVISPEALTSRDVLVQELRRHLGEPPVRGVVVAPLSTVEEGRLPEQELMSVLEEVGAHPQRDPGEDLDATSERWTGLFRLSEGMLLTEEADALESLAASAPARFVRLSAPESPEQLLYEAWVLARRGGGHWVYVGENPRFPAPLLDDACVGQLAGYLGAAPAGTPLWIDAESLVEAMGWGSRGPVEALGAELETLLQAFAAAGLVERVTQARFVLEVVESHRFASPHIDADDRYLELSRRFEKALSEMGMLKSVRFRLNARQPRDVREMATVLGYGVTELNVLFDDLAREDLVLCRQKVSGTAGNSNFEVRPASDAASRVEGALALVLAWRRQRLAAQAQVAGLLSGGAAALEVWRHNLGDGGALSIDVQSLPPIPAASVTAPAPTTVLEIPSAPAAAPTPPPVGLELLLEADSELPELAEGEALQGLVERLRALPTRATLLRRLGQALELHPERVRQRTAEVLWQSLEGDGEAAAQSLLRWLEQTPAGDSRNQWLIRLLVALDYRVEVQGRVEITGLPLDACILALLLPALEGLNAEQTAPILDAAGLTVTIENERGVTMAVLGERRYGFQRQGATPETEAALWLLLESLDQTVVPAELIRARLNVVWLMLAGLGDPALIQQLSRSVFDSADLSTWCGGPQRSLALARACLAAGDAERTLLWLEGAADGGATAVELARVRAEALLLTGDARGAAGVLTAAGVAAVRGEGAVLWQKIATAYFHSCEAQASCEGCGLHGTDFCPAAADFWTFVEQNPLGENRRQLKVRLEKRAAFDLAVDSVRRLAQVFERMSGTWTEAVLERWIGALEGGSPEDWMRLAQRLAEHRPAAARLSLARIPAEIEDGRMLQQLFRGHLELGEPLLALTRAVRLESMGEAFWEPMSVVRELTQRLGSEWLVTGVPGIEEGSSEAELIKRLQAVEAARQANEQLRQRLAMQLEKGRWSDLRRALAEYSDAMGEAGASDRLIREAQQKLSEREKRLLQRVDAIAGVLPTQPAARAELVKLAGDAELGGFAEVVTRAREVLAQFPAAEGTGGGERSPMADRGQGERRSQDGRSNEGGARGRGRGEGPAPARSGEQPGGRRGSASAGESSGRGDGRRGSERPRGADTRASEGEAHTGQGRASGDGRRGEQKRGGQDFRPRGPEFFHLGPASSLEIAEVLASCKSMSDDRERLRMAMPTVWNLLGSDEEKGCKFVRDLIPLMASSVGLDRALTLVIQDGRPSDASLGRLKRILNSTQGNGSFPQALEALAVREHPDPWKQVLGQLKLKA